MPCDVGVKIQHYETVLTAVQNEVRRVLLGIACDQAKDTTVSLRINARCDVPGTPGTPQSFQFRHLDVWNLKDGRLTIVIADGAGIVCRRRM